MPFNLLFKSFIFELVDTFHLIVLRYIWKLFIHFFNFQSQFSNLLFDNETVDVNPVCESQNSINNSIIIEKPCSHKLVEFRIIWFKNLRNIMKKWFELLKITTLSYVFFSCNSSKNFCEFSYQKKVHQIWISYYCMCITGGFL